MKKSSETSLTIDELQQQTAKQAQKIAELSAELNWYKEQFHLAQQKRFGSSSERTHPDQLTLELFNEAEPRRSQTCQSQRSKRSPTSARKRSALVKRS
ncbi:transposase [Paenibacillus harenae]|uniref:transposase n=1 Tax=Paenibacillus harenae TaxID=306543 RepID=UPI0027D8BB8C|nr:transposase [Paenibacillus harenae]